MNPRNSKVILAKGISMDKDYNNVIDYSEANMLSLLRASAHKVAEFTGYSFIRETGYLEMQVPYSTALGSNYMAFQNADYSNKWFFAWVDDVEYRGENNTRIKYTIDCWSTWYNDWTAKKCFVKRHHVNDDTIGVNRVPENIAVNNVLQIDITEDTALTDYWIIMQTDWIFNDNSVATTGGIGSGEQFSGITPFNGLISGHQYILFDTGTELSTIANAYTYIKRTIARTNAEGHINDIRNLFAVPKALIKSSNLTYHIAYTTSADADHKIEFYTLDNGTIPVAGEHYSITINKNTSYTGYTPKNNKVFQYPWNYLYVTNNNGNYNIYKYEDFYGQATATFDISLALTIGVSGKLAPTNYKGQGIDLDNGIALAKYPTFAWSSDAFTNWLTSQAVNLATNWIGGATSVSRSKDSETPVTPEQAGFSIAGKIADTIGMFYTGSLMPNIDGGTNTGDVNFSRARNTFYFKRMMASLEDIKIADDYFTRFGYAIKKIETPNITGRTYWNYVEIGDTEEIGYGDVPNKFMEEINKACRKGVTVWHSHDNIGNWDLTNSIVTP